MTRDLFFWLPKLLDFVEQPLEWVLLLLLASAVLRWRRRQRLARYTVTLATVVLAATGVTAVPDLILQRLEDAYPRTDRPVSAFDGVLVLGGGLDGGSAAIERGQTLLGSSAERVTTAVALARSWPELKIVLTGYAGLNEPAGLSEAQATVRFFEEQGLPTAGLLKEPASRNTAEIAENAKRLSGVDPSRPWLLLTSAWNMPRALLTFRNAGWNVEPLPVDYLTGTSVRYFRYSLSRGSSKWNIVLHELGGMAWYRVTGRL